MPDEKDQPNHNISLGGEIRPSGQLDAERRVVHVEGSDGGSVGDGYDVSASEDGNVTGLRIGPASGGGFAADLDSGDRVTTGAQDQGYTGEGRGLVPCQILVRAWNRAGGSFGEPELANPEGHHSEESGYDCIANGPNGEIRMQVTRAVRDQTFWSALSEDGLASAATTVDQLARSLAETVRAKARKLGQSGIVLVLDATQHIGGLLPRVVEATRAAYGKELGSLRFAAVWLVGPDAERCHQLDLQES